MVKNVLLLIYEKELNIFRKKFSEDNELSSIKSRCNINDSIIESIRSMDSANLSARSHEKIVKRRNISPDYGIYDPRKSDDKTVLNELSSEIYKEFDKDIATDAYNSTHCGNLNGDIQNICKKLARNLKELSTNNVTKNENHKDRCTHLNFWIYDAVSKKHKNIDQNLSDMTEFADILHADIKINNDLIKKYLIENSKSFSPKETETQNQNSGNDLNTQGKDDTQRSTDNAEAKTLGKHTGKEVPTADTERTVHTGTTEEPGSTGDKGTTVPGKNTGTGGNTKSKDIPDPYKIVNYKELSKYNPCVFNYDCTLSECREMKHLYEYFKAYDTIKSNIKCGDGKNDKYFKYIKYISFLYNKHKEDCCSWSAEICPDYFLSCDEYYNPSKFVSALESSDIATCDEMLKAPIPKKSEDVFSVDPNSEDNMYIKYFTCSYVTDSKFEKKGLRCQQPGYSAHLNDRLSARRNIIKRQNNTSGLDGKKITINGKTINAVLISDPYAKITGEDGAENSMPDDQYTLFPEIRGAARKAYVKQAEEACKNGEIKEGMEEYCRKSARYNKIINSKGLRCQQPGYSAHLNDRLSARRNVIKPQNNTSGLDGKKIIINGKTINVVLISDPYAKITGKDGTENSIPNDQYTLFPEIKGAARQAYVKQGEEACKNGKIKEGMEEYCRKSERYNKIINSVNSQSANVTLEKDIENLFPEIRGAAYFTCSYVTDSKFEKKGLRCQQPGYSAHLNDRLSARRNVIKPQNNTSGLDGKKIIINGKTINVVLISDPYAKITGKDGTENSIPNDQYTLHVKLMSNKEKKLVKTGK
ncbi:VIR protein [Plasmodium vivax]|uniref:VIR protein n=1 Tax=Plasmodium vivax TaxID=5855 RepID=A0A1G4E6R2_PLAVI|nr:VIR protein [Plasmodium vivax]